MSQSPNDSPYQALSYFALTLDPVHVGVGGMRLGRVDMPIVREAGSNLPTIPGTSLSGACRTYAAMQEPGKFPHCAGQGQADNERNYRGHCGDPDCPICVTFGFSKGDQGSFQGLAQFSDAHLVFFPVHSLAGPVWVTSPSILRELSITQPSLQEDAGVRVASGLQTIQQLNLGWLMLPVEKTDLNLPKEKFSNLPDDILTRAVLVSDKIFGHIVNDNLEVRTSVSIDPATGAAAEGALFTYEALPRACVLRFDVIISNPQYYQIGSQKPLEKKGGIEKVRSTVENGLRLFEMLGIGGMNTRGMGRLRVLNLQEGGTQ